MISTISYSFRHGEHPASDAEKVKAELEQRIRDIYAPRGGAEIQGWHFNIHDEFIVKVTVEVKHGLRNL